MFCRNCGKKVEDGMKFCVSCGVKVLPKDEIMKENAVENSCDDFVSDKIPSLNENNNIEIVKNDEDKNSIILNVLSLFYPLIGLILYIVWKNQFPKKAKNIGICTIIGYILKLLVSLLVVVYMSRFSGKFNIYYDGYDYKNKENIEQRYDDFSDYFRNNYKNSEFYKQFEKYNKNNGYDM